MKHICIKAAEANLLPQSGYVIRIWGWDKHGVPVNSFLTCTRYPAMPSLHSSCIFCSLHCARCAAAAALVELGSRIHLYIETEGGHFGLTTVSAECRRLFPRAATT
jgi:hypothetical protein